MCTLIVYATKHGSVKRCAEILSSKFDGQVVLINIKETEDLDLSKYDKVIIGGSIYAGRIQKEILEFCNNNLKELLAKKIALFICCMIEKEAEKQLATAFPKELLDCSLANKSFGGELKFKEMSFWERLISKMVSKLLAKGDPSLVLDTKENISKLSMKDIDDLAKIMNEA